MLRMHTAASIRPRRAKSHAHKLRMARPSQRYRFVPRDSQLCGMLLSICDLAILAGVTAGVIWLITRSGGRVTSAMPHFIVTCALSFIIIHMLGKSYDLSGYVKSFRGTQLDFVLKPAVLTGLATTFSYLVERSLGQGALAATIQLDFVRLSPELGVTVFATVAIALERVAVYRLFGRLHAAGHFSTNVVVFGADDIGRRLIQLLREQYADSVRVLGVYDDRAGRTPSELCGYAVEEGIDRLIEHLKKDPSIDKVLVAIPMHAEKRILDLLVRLRSVAVEVAIVPDFIGTPLESHLVRDYQPLALSLSRKPQSDFDWAVKRGFDIAASLALLVILSPMLLLTALLIKLDSKGPIFFRQPRLGLNNEVFNVLKFRSMYVEQADLEARQQTKRGDARITRVGGWLRKLSIDELPQLINVLRGDMSLVGPRPHALGMQVQDRLCDEIVREYAVRHRMKPGITGWAQVRGLRGAVEDPELLKARVRHDIYYIDNWSFFFDLRILVLTAFELLRPRNAF